MNGGTDYVVLDTYNWKRSEFLCIQANIDELINGTSKWVKFVESILSSQLCNPVWNHQQTINEDRLKYSVKNKLQAEHVQLWSSANKNMNSS